MVRLSLFGKFIGINWSLVKLKISTIHIVMQMCSKNEALNETTT